VCYKYWFHGREVVYVPVYVWVWVCLWEGAEKPTFANVGIDSCNKHNGLVFKPISIGFRPISIGFRPISIGFRPISIGFRPISIGFRPICVGQYSI